MEVQMTDTLDMTGDWKLTYGSQIGLTTDNTPAKHLVPLQPGATYVVHFNAGVPTANGLHHDGFYKPNNPPHNPGSESVGALKVDTFYADRGVFVVQLLDHVEKYFAVLSGYHQHYPTDPTRVEIVGGWADVGEFQTASGPTVTSSHKGNFTLVKIS